MILLLKVVVSFLVVVIVINAVVAVRAGKIDEWRNKRRKEKELKRISQKGELAIKPYTRKTEAWEPLRDGSNLCYEGVKLKHSGEYGAKRKFNRAIKYYDKALKIDSQYGWVWKNKADALMKLGRYEEAVKCYDNVPVRDPHSEYAESIQEALALAEAKRVKQVEDKRVEDMKAEIIAKIDKELGE